MKSSVLASVFFGLAAAHFELNYPKPIGFKEDTEDTGPCGGFTPDFSKDKLVDFHVGGDSLAMTLTHPQCNWLFRVTTDEKAEKDWEQIFPIVQQSGLGAFCEPSVTVPEKYIGKKGVLSVVSDAVDGLLFQCVSVNFVQGKADVASECKNASSVKASFASDPKLTALLGNTTSSSASGSAASGASKTSGSSASASSSSAATALQPGFGAGQSWGAALAVLSMAVLGGALMV